MSGLTSEAGIERDVLGEISDINAGSALPPDLEVLAELEADLRKRRRDLDDATEKLRRDRLSHEVAAEQLARDQSALEAAWAGLTAREKALEGLKVSIVEREITLSAEMEQVETGTRTNKLWAEQLAKQHQQQAPREAALKDLEGKLAAREVKLQTADARHRQRLKELKEAKSRVTDLESDVLKLTKDRDRLKKKIDSASKAVPSPLQVSAWSIAEWMLGSLEIDQESFASKVAFSGNGPFSQADLEANARDKGLKVGRCGARQAAKVLVVGRTGWDKRSIQTHIDALSEDELFIFPQELWVAAMLIGYNPFRYLEDAACRSSVEAFGVEHPVIEWLRSEQSPWPEWELSSGDPGSVFDQKVKVSPLVKLDYRVGKINGLPSSARRRILSDALSTAALPEADFEAGVRPATQREYMASWGTPSSRMRLRRMAWHLAMLITMHARLRNHEVAVQEWQDDLAWLRETYYSALMRFQWP